MPTGINNFMAIQRKANLIGFGVLNQGSDLSWILGVSGGSGGSPVPVNLTSQINGITNTFALGGSPASAALCEVIFNSATLTPTTDYSVTGSTLTLTFVPQVGDFLYVRYWTT